MVIGVTMVKISPDHEKETYNALRGRDDIVEVYNLFGEYDLLVILEARHKAELRRILKDIRGWMMGGVQVQIQGRTSGAQKQKDFHSTRI
jgi:DNA-binding Lrp family transcriptional regulator